MDMSLVLAFCLIFSSSPSVASPLEFLLETPLTELNSIHSSTSCSSEYSCVDLHTVRICAPYNNGSFYELYRIGCAGTYSWCDPKSVSCVPEEPPEYTTTIAPVPVTPVPNLFKCMGNGYFPDLSDCSRYYNCVEDEPYLLECSGTTPYYAFEYQTCYETADLCANNPTTGAVCSGSNPNWFRGKQQLGSLGKYFYYCTGTTPITVNRCFGAYKYNLTSETCEPHCPHAGLFPSAEDCAQYYRCSPVSGDLYETEFTMTLDLTCPEGQGFQEKTFQCTDRSLVPNCAVSAS